MAPVERASTGPGVGDINGDGSLDVAALVDFPPGTGGVTVTAGTGGSGFTQPTDGYVAVLANTGTGRWPSPAYYPVPLNPTSTALGDVTGDGKLDLAVVSSAPNGSVTVFGNQGGGTFGSGINYATGVMSTAVAIANLDTDSRPDIVVTNRGSVGVSADVSVLWNDGGGFFAADSIPGGTDPVAIAAADLGGDGLVDLLVASGTDSLNILTNKASRTFGAPMPSAIGTMPSSVTVSDLNGDGRPDVHRRRNSANAARPILRARCVAPPRNTLGIGRRRALRDTQPRPRIIAAISTAVH